MNAVPTDSDTARQESLPHYMRPNFSSILPEYANAEADQIRSAFATGNYTSLQKLPSKLVANAVTHARFEQMDENRVAHPPPPRMGKLVTKNGLFNQFEYAPSRFSLADELAQLERVQSEAKRAEISGRDFVSCPDGLKTKFEDAFGDLGFRYPHLHEPYPDTTDEARHAKWLEDKKILHGAFVPSGMRPSVDAVTRKVAPEIIKELHEAFAADWEGVTFSIAVTDDENLAVRFDVATVECESGLIAYMNVFVRSHRVPSKYKLHKVAEDWNAKPGDGGLYFVFRPPWVRNRSKDLIMFASAPGSSSKKDES